MNFVIKSKKKAKKKIVKKNTIKKAKKRIKRNKFNKKYKKKKNKSRKLKRGGGRFFPNRYEGHTFINTIDDTTREKVDYSLNDNINKLDINKGKKILFELFSIFYENYGNVIDHPELYLDRIRDETNRESELGILYTNPTLTISLRTRQVFLNTSGNKDIDTRDFITLTNIIKTFYKTIFDLGLIKSKIKDTPKSQERKLLSDEVKKFFLNCSTPEFEDYIESIEVPKKILIELIAGLYKEFTYKDNEKYYNIDESKYNIFFINPVINTSDSKLYESSDLEESEYINSDNIMRFRNELNKILIYLNNPK